MGLEIETGADCVLGGQTLINQPLSAIEPLPALFDIWSKTDRPNPDCEPTNHAKALLFELIRFYFWGFISISWALGRLAALCASRIAAVTSRNVVQRCQSCVAFAAEIPCFGSS